MKKLKEHTCSFSGHRLQKLPQNPLILIKLKRKLKFEIKQAITNGYSHFISGMALGVDLFCSEIIIKLKKRYNITLECAIPPKKYMIKY